MRFAAAVLAALLLFSFGNAPAQDTTATAAQGIRLQAYGLGSYVKPQQFTTGALTGGTVGATVEAFRFHGLQPALDVRASGGFGSTRQLFFGGGPRVGMTFGRVQPYADFLLGYGSMHFTSADPAYTHDNSVVTAFGGGVDVRLNRSWAIRADVQRQSWQWNEKTDAFHPVTASFGLRYQFHFKNKYGPE